MAAAENMFDETFETAARSSAQGAGSVAPRTPIVQLVWDVAQLARSMARVHERRERPSRRGRLRVV